VAQWIEVADTSEIPLNEGKAFPVGDRMIAIFRVGDDYHAMDDFCPHQGASLAGGWIHDGCVACPWHAWRFKLTNGEWLDNPKIKTDVFPVELRGTKVFVEIPVS
jgi:nitrite reductase (NADH) small subunit/3-phenylpropionate/trans-cinnamate dioxygenase ferredoxin subunit